jgi:xanthine dehydrogenase YagR molybdenum-binding subunit
MALSEATHYDPRTGWIATEGLADYHMAVNADVPDIDISWLNEPDPVISELSARWRNRFDRRRGRGR